MREVQFPMIFVRAPLDSFDGFQNALEYWFAGADFYHVEAASDGPCRECDGILRNICRITNLIRPDESLLCLKPRAGSQQKSDHAGLPAAGGPTQPKSGRLHSFRWVFIDGCGCFQ